MSTATLLPTEETLERAALESLQGRKLVELLRQLDGPNRFYTRKLEAAGLKLDELRFPRDLAKLPFTTKAELTSDQAANPPWGTALSEPLAHYTRYCQTSSTTGQPLRWIDTNESWQWLLECWKAVYRAARVGQGDRAFFPVLVRAVPRLLGGLRRGLAGRGALRAGRRHVEPAAPVA